MSQHDDAVSLRQMRDHAREAVEFSIGRQRSDLDTDRMLCLALTRLVEVVGEAANRVSQPCRGSCPDITWSEIIGMRHHLSHGYDRVDPGILWNVVTKDLPLLIDQLDRVLSEGNDVSNCD